MEAGRLICRRQYNIRMVLNATDIKGLDKVELGKDTVKGKGLPQQAEVAQGFPGRLRH